MKQETFQMKRSYVFLLFLVIIFLSQFAFADTEIGGNITEDTTWTVADSPYIVTCNVQVLEGVLLTIEAGVEIKFNEGYSLLIGGNLKAVGEEGNYIVFTSNSDTPSAGEWGGIQFLQNLTYRNTLKYCRFEYGETVIQTNGAYCDVIDCIIINNEVGIDIFGYSMHDNEIKNNIIEYNNSCGIQFRHRGSGVINNNKIRYNMNRGIYAHTDGNLDIENNEISYNQGFHI